MKNESTKCYSYTRWSSTKQGNGTTLERQRYMAINIAEKYELELVENYSDDGISAFKGKNSKSGGLGDFIADVKSGQIEVGSWLVVENLDRISREDILKAQRLFMELLELGITVVTGMDGKVYSGLSVIENPMDLMYSIMLFSRAHEESRTKSNRTINSAAIAIKRHLDEERAENGFAFSIKAVGNNIWWSDCSDGTVKPHPYFYPIAKEIIQLAFNGWGSYRIVGYLNNKYDAPRSKKDEKEGTVKKWLTSRITNLLNSRTLLGDKVINLSGITHTLKAYYPQLLDEDTYYQLQHVRKERTSKSTSVKYSHILSGLGILKCGWCGHNMYAFTHKKTVMRFICGNGSANKGCRCWSFNATWLEDTVIRLAANNIFRPEAISENMDVIVSGYRAQIDDKQQQLENLFGRIQSGEKAYNLSSDIDRLQNEIEHANKQLEQAKQTKSKQVQDSVEWGKVDARVLDLNESDLRTEIRQKIELTVKEVICHQVKEGHILFEIKFANGKKITAHRTSQALAFDGVAWEHLSDHHGIAVYTSSDNQVADNQPKTYRGLFNLSESEKEDYQEGRISKPVAADIVRIRHLMSWAKGIKGAPKIIEDQNNVFTHQYRKYVVSKPSPSIHHIDNVDTGDWQQ